MTAAVTSSQPAALICLLDDHVALVLSGAPGIGKTHLLREVRDAWSSAGRTPTTLSATALGRDVPLGVFAGGPTVAAESVELTRSALIAAFSRRRSTSALVVDNADHLDEASVFVIRQLIVTVHIPTVISVRDLSQLPAALRELYDGGELHPVQVVPLGDAEAVRLVEQHAGGRLTAASRSALIQAGGGNPLHLRELVLGSIEDGRLQRTSHGYELSGGPGMTTRLTEIVGERLAHLSDVQIETLAVIAICGSAPPSVTTERERVSLARAGVIEHTREGRLRLAHPLYGEVLRSRCADALWHELTRRSVSLLRSEDAQTSTTRRRAAMLSIDAGLQVESEDVLDLAEHALAAFDEALALRAATAVLATRPDDADALRIGGAAASSLGETVQADRMFASAHEAASTPAERAAVAIAHARVLGADRYDASAALAVIQRAIDVVDDNDAEALGLRAAELQWGTIAGLTGLADAAGDEPTEGASPMVIATMAVAGVVTGPWADTQRHLDRLRGLPTTAVAMMPGGAALLDLTEAMALSYTGDIVATRERITERIGAVARDAPETLGTWEYALGVVELFCSEAEAAYTVATDAAVHLAWRDPVGLLPAARALVGAAAHATGRAAESHAAFGEVPAPALQDPKVFMLRCWTDARQAVAERRIGDAGRILTDGARWLLEAQHTYFAATIAHGAVRLQGDLAGEAADVIRRAEAIAGSALLRLMVDHVDAMQSGDLDAMQDIANQAQELGLTALAVDTWAALAARPGQAAAELSDLEQRHWQMKAELALAERPSLALWTAPVDRSLTLTPRELDVAMKAARRLTAREIADLNGVSPNTVTNQLSSAFRKLGVRSRAELRDVLGSDDLTRS